MCAVLGLRALFTLTVALVKQFPYVQHAVALLLLFVGGKIVLDVVLGVTISTHISLCVIAGSLISGVLASVVAQSHVCRRLTS